jgi:hypothetical protein
MPININRGKLYSKILKSKKSSIKRKLMPRVASAFLNIYYYEGIAKLKNIRIPGFGRLVFIKRNKKKK